MLQKTYTSSIAAFKGINKTLIFEEDQIKEHGFMQSSQANLYNLLVRVERSWIPEDFDFTSLANYRAAKGTSLINNYLDRDYLEEVVALVLHNELKKKKAYNISFHFTNAHDGGKGCLLTCTFARRYNDPTPVLIATVRASESFKRLLFDFLLLHRMGEMAYGDQPFAIEIFFPYIWGVPDWLAMYLRFAKIAYNRAKKAPNGTFAYQVFKKYQQMLDTSEEDMNNFKYHALKRTWKVVNKKTATPPYLASDIQI